LNVKFQSPWTSHPPILPPVASTTLPTSPFNSGIAPTISLASTSLSSANASLFPFSAFPGEGGGRTDPPDLNQVQPRELEFARSITDPGDRSLTLQRVANVAITQPATDTGFGRQLQVSAPGGLLIAVLWPKKQGQIDKRDKGESKVKREARYKNGLRVKQNPNEEVNESN